MTITKQQAQEGLAYMQREIQRLSKIQGSGAKLTAAQQIVGLLEAIFNEKLTEEHKDAKSLHRDAEHMLADYLKMPDVATTEGGAEALKKLGRAGLADRFKNL